MKLNELYGPDDISMGDRPVKAGQFQHPKTKQLGKGHYAKAFDHPTRPGSVIKVVERIKEPHRDAQVVFTDLSMKNQDNPFFPRIYQAKVLQEDNGNHILIVEMEKLHPIFRENIRHMIPHMLKQIGVSKEDIQGIISTGLTSRNLTDDEFEEANIDFFLRIGSTSKMRELEKISKNEKFKEAVSIINNWMSMFQYDLSANNWMFRITSVGPQLVMMDPIS